MKNFRSAISVLAMLVTVCSLTSCNAPAPQPPTITMQRVELDKTDTYLITPAVFKGHALVTDAATYYGHRNQGIIEYDLDTREERELDFFAQEPQCDENYYYWMEINESEQHNQLFRMDRKTGTKEMLHDYRLEDKEQFTLPRLSYGDGHLVWADGIYNLDNEGFAHNPSWSIYTYDCSTKDIRLAATTNYCFSPFYTYKIRNGNFVYASVKGERVLTESVPHEFTFHCIDLNDPDQTEKNHTTVLDDCDILGLVYDGRYLIWVTRFNLTVYDFKTKKERIISNTTNVGDVDILKGRYIIYVDDFKVRVFDLAQDKEVYYSDVIPGDQYEYLSWFSVDENSNTALFQSEIVGTEEIAISLLKIDD